MQIELFRDLLGSYKKSNLSEARLTMFFKKKDGPIQETSIQSVKVKLEYVNETIKKQLQMLSLTEDDLKYLKIFKPVEEKPKRRRVSSRKSAEDAGTAEENNVD